jgi:hypothetical protein
VFIIHGRWHTPKIQAILKNLVFWDFIPNFILCQEKNEYMQWHADYLINTIDIDALSIMKLGTRKGTIATASPY